MASAEIPAGDEERSSMSLRTRKLGRRLSRSMSIVALKLPEKAQSLTRRSSKLLRAGARDKKPHTFELSVILPDKTQRQVSVSGSRTVAQAVAELARELAVTLADAPSAPLSAPRPLALGAALPPPGAPTSVPARVLLLLGECRAPVDSRAAAAALEGEVLLLEAEPPTWDGRDLRVFLAWEKIYASTLLSAVELYGKPLLRAAAITNEEYHVLFYYLQIVSEASTSLTERMQSYLDSGLLKNDIPQEQPSPTGSIQNDPEERQRSILNELVCEGFLTQSDVDKSSESAPTETYGSRSGSKRSEYFESGVSTSAAPKGTAESVFGSEATHSICDTDSHYDEERAQEISIVTVGGQCCADHRISSDVSENVWANVRWDFLGPSDFGYDRVPGVRRSRSDSALSPRAPRRRSVRDDIYETVEDDADEETAAEGREEEAGGMTPYESIEDLYDCIKSAPYGDKSDAGGGRTEAHYADSCLGSVAVRQSSTESERSATSSASPYSHSTDGEYVSRLFPPPPPPPPPRAAADGESAILLQQLFSGELADVYGEYLSAYRHARALLRHKLRRDEHFAALADIRRGVARHTISDYLELPIERLAQYERLAGAGGAAACGRRRGARLSDLERVQDLFPHDYLALHEHDALATQYATQKTKSLRKRPSLDLSGSPGASAGGGGGGGGGGAGASRTFVMEAPVTLRALAPDSPPLDRHLFLFSDVLLVGKARGAGCFKLKESVRLAEAWLALPDGEDTAFLLGWPGAPPAAAAASYLARYPTQAARDTWYRKLQNALNTQLANEPKSTNIQVLYKDSASSIEFCKTLSVTPDMTTLSVIRQALQLFRSNNAESAEGAWGPAHEFALWARGSRDAPPAALHGTERPHAIQMSRIRQTLSSEDGFDLEHVNAKNHPCGMVFELRKKSNGLKNTTSPGVGSRGLRLLRRGGPARLFGVSLARLNGGAPPPLVLQLLRRLRAHAPHTHGVFRRSANVKALRLLRDKLDALGGGCAWCAELERAPVLLLAALLKDFFRSLPQPLLTGQLYHSWVAVLGMPPTEKVAAVRSLLIKLPKSHYTMLTYFICLLQAIAKKSPVNQMCPMNLGVCVGPSLLWPSAPCDKAPKAVPMVIELLIVKADALFGPQVGNLLGGGGPESSAALPDSGAEESDSLHSVGISLDSMELSSPRKEKLSLSRDSGLTLSEDDSNSNGGGNSPAPRAAPSVPTAPPPPRRASDTINVNGLPHIASHYSTDAATDDYYASPYSPTERYVHNSIDIGIERSYDERIRSRREDIYGRAPAKYITGLEPQKPPRSNVSKAARTSKVYSMFSESREPERTAQVSKTFNRAKSSDDLLDIKQKYDSKLASSQENILYSNAGGAANSAEEQNCQDHYQNMEFLSNTNYSRVYTGWEKRSAATYGRVGNDHTCLEKIYGLAGGKLEERKPFSPNRATSQAAPTFARNDWSRQAARTRSLEVSEDTYVSKCSEERPRGHCHEACRRRRVDPAHLCSAACSERAAPSQPSYSPTDGDGTSPRHRHQTNGQRIAHSKSLAEIILQSDSSGGDAPYVSYRAVSGDSASDASYESRYSAHYAEPPYAAVYGRRRADCDIYTAEPTAVQPHPPPPVPPRKVLLNRYQKKFPAERGADEDRGSRSKSVPPAYRDPPNSDKHKTDVSSQGNVLALDCSDTDTESESYV